MMTGNMLVRSIRAQNAHRETHRELVKGFTLIGIIPIIMSCIVYVTYGVMSWVM